MELSEKDIEDLKSEIDVWFRSRGIFPQGTSTRFTVTLSDTGTEVAFVNHAVLTQDIRDRTIQVPDLDSGIAKRLASVGLTTVGHVLDRQKSDRPVHSGVRGVGPKSFRIIRSWLQRLGVKLGPEWKIKEPKNMGWKPDFES